jgi:hypothetical protein
MHMPSLDRSNRMVLQARTSHLSRSFKTWLVQGVRANRQEPLVGVIFVISLLLVGLFAFSVQAQELNDNQRLEALRKALIELSLEGPTEVRSSAFIDESGALREGSSFNNAMVIRGVRILAYGQDSVTGPTAQLAAAKAERLNPASCKALDSGRMKKNDVQHLVVMDINLSPKVPNKDVYLSRLVVLALKENLQNYAQQSGVFKLRLSTLPVNTSASTGVGAGANVGNRAFGPGQNYYEQALLGRGEHRVTWQLHVRLEPYVDEFSYSPGLKVVSVLENRLDPRLTFERFETIGLEPLPEKPSSAALSSVMLAQVEGLSSNMKQWFEDQLSCIPPQFEVTQWTGNQLNISAGSANGLHEGDKFVVVDPKLIPGRALQADALQHMALAQVQFVSLYSAQLKQVAGPSLKNVTHWVAIPQQLRD